MRTWMGDRLHVAAQAIGAFVFLFALLSPAIAGVSREEALRLGERIYREGILPSGEPLQAVVKGDIPVAGTAFSCVSCHQRSGLGSYEGGVLTPPTNGRSLFQPLKRLYKGIEVASMPVLRPAYTDASLAEVLRSGTDPSGRVLDAIMPRYMLEDQDMALLISYLKSLSSEFSPGVSDTSLSFATVITDDVSPEDRETMLGVLEDYVKRKNGMARSYGMNARQARMAEAMLPSGEVAHKRLSLAQWLVKGPPETWRSQLQEYYRKEPVFALLGGITKGEWGPIHKFSEDNRIPCILPITDFPVISETDWYTLYFSKGLYQEGERAARYLQTVGGPRKGGSIVQFVRESREGRALWRGFQETWRELGNRAPVTVKLKAGEKLTAKILAQALERERPVALIIWDGPDALPAIEGLPAAGVKPEMVIVSSGYLGKAMWKLKEEARDLTYITYPFRLPQDEARFGRYDDLSKKSRELGDDVQTVLKQSYTITLVLTQLLVNMKGQYFRDNLLDVIGMGRSGAGMGMGTGTVEQDETYPLYERVSFGPGQRYASKGCYIVQLARGSRHELIKKSDWAAH